MDRRGADRGLVGKPEGKRLLGRPRLKWDCNIKLDFNILHVNITFSMQYVYVSNFISNLLR